MGIGVSLCMIVRNEAHVLGTCLDSVRDLVTQHCIVDTGSNDGTVELLRGRGIEPHPFPWQGDFAAARNFSLSLASEPWILVLDSDEEFNPADLITIRHHLAEPTTCWEFFQRHYTNDPRISNFTPCRGEAPHMERGEAGYFESALVRLFPNRREITYRGRIHELVEHRIKEIPGLTIKRSPVRIHHYGHTRKLRTIKREKSALYTNLGETKAQESPTDWKAFFELGVQHNVDGRLAESAEALKRAATLNPHYSETWVNLGYVLCELGEHKEALTALQHALTLAPDHPEGWCNAGVVKLRVGDFVGAEKLFRRSLALRPHYVNALCNTGLAIAKQGRLPEAVLFYERALGCMPECVAALCDLAVLYAYGALDKRSRELLERADRIAPHDRRVAEAKMVINEVELSRSAHDQREGSDKPQPVSIASNSAAR